MEKIFEYPCQFFRQREKSTVQCVFVASTADVHEWAGVPVKQDTDLRNFQRPEIKGHADEIGEFFNNFDANTSPSSIVVGFRKGAKVECFNVSGNKLDLKAIQSGVVEPGKIRVSADVFDPLAAAAEKRSLLEKIIAELLSESVK